ncbi:hypothetical protein MPH_04062 [Macrophomina phaseolina MS6]|uniref:Uncharacterized protein n=1 Tax=Macrophomina phaseolina (strain MS6) TaxID=1126212 RepID=K2R8I2_MACPH|nr:hypothetical protein MPH_04062 [Macrophomina phaseolina MS6]
MSASFDSTRGYIYVSHLAEPQPIASVEYWYQCGHYIYDCLQMPARPGAFEGQLLRIKDDPQHPEWEKTLGENDEVAFAAQDGCIEELKKTVLEMEAQRARKTRKNRMKLLAKRASKARKREAAEAAEAAEAEKEEDGA